jgi:hypothetical protein
MAEPLAGKRVPVAGASSSIGDLIEIRPLGQP